MNYNNQDPLFLAFEKFAQLYYKPINLQTLLADLPEVHTEPADGIHNTVVFERAATRAGYQAKLIEKPLLQLSNLVLPCLLLLKDRGVCILERLDVSQAKAKIVHLELEGGEVWVDIGQLQAEYLGFAYLLKPEYEYQKRALGLVTAPQKHWFWSTLARSRSIYRSVLLASLLINLFVLVTPLFTMNVYDRVVPNDALETLWVLAFGVTVVLVVDILLKLLRNYLLEIASKRSDVIMSSLLFEQALGLKLEVFPASVGAFANKLREFESVRNFLTSASLVALIDIPFAILFLMVIFYIGSVVVLVPIVVIIALLVYSYFIAGPLKKSVESTFEAAANKHSLLIESLHSIRTIKALGVSRQAQWEWEEATGDIAQKSVESRMLSASITAVTSFLVNVNTVGVLVVGIYTVRDLELSLGGLIAIVILSSRSIAPMGQLASLIANYQQTKTAYDSLNNVMALPNERPISKTFVSSPQFKGKLQFSDVSFTYPDVERPTLQNVSFSMKAGEKIGIIGKIGSGKSTLASLIAALYSPTSGVILADDLDIQQIDPADLRRNMDFLSQDSGLLRGSVRDNIVYRDPHVSDEKLFAAANVGGVDLFLNRYEKGFDTLIGEQGQGLSGGQRQSVLLARALLLPEPLVILDEPTSAMDPTTESVVRERLKAYTADKSLILITHKATMLELVDRLIVLDEGRVMMDGPKAKVLEALNGG